MTTRTYPHNRGRDPVAVVGGTVLDLRAMKQAIRHDFGMTQRDFANEAGIHQSQVSRLLKGEFHPKGDGRSMSSNDGQSFMSTFKALLASRSRKTLGYFEYQGNNPQTVPNTTQRRQARAQQQAQQGPSKTFDEVIDSLDGNADSDDSEAETERIEPDDGGFPIARAQEIASMARAANRESQGLEFSEIFSMRRVITWGRLFRIMRDQAGLGWQDAVGSSYWLAAVYAANDEDQTFLLEAFQRIMKFDAREPHNLIDHRPEQHPQEPIVELLARNGVPVWAYGETGCGKSYAVESVAARLSRTDRYHRFQGDGEVSKVELIGGKEAEGGTTYHGDGPLPHAMANGEPFITDEISICDTTVLAVLQAVAEGKPLYIPDGEGRYVHAEPGFLLLATDNTRGTRGDPRYTGTKPVNDSMRNRFAFVHFDWMPRHQECAIIESEISKGFTFAIAEQDDADPDPRNGGDDPEPDIEDVEWYERLAG